MNKSDPSTPLADSEIESDDVKGRQMMANKGRNLNFIDNSRLIAVLGAAVRHAVKRNFDDVAEEKLMIVAQAAQRGFSHLIKNNGKAVRGVPVKDFVKEVEESKNQILREREQARIELNRLKQELQGRQSEMRSERDALLLDQNVDAAVTDGALAERLNELFESMEQTPELAQIRELVSSAALQSVKQERSKSLEEKLRKHDSEVANYQRRISKLTDSLSRTEKEIVRLANIKDVDTGVESIYRQVQGLSGNDESAESKKEMMMAIFEANLSLQDKAA